MSTLQASRCWIKVFTGLRVAVGLAALACLLSCTRLDASDPATNDRATSIPGAELPERDSPAQAIPQVREVLGQTEWERYQEAIAGYDQALRLDPDDALAYFYRGAAKGKLGQYIQAIADYDQVLRRDSDNAKAYVNRGLAKGSAPCPP